MRFVHRAFLIGIVVFLGCDDDSDRTPCDPDDPDACGPGARCVTDSDGEPYCEELAGCDPEDASSCPAGYVCRPSSWGPVCEPEPTAGRIPSCIDSEGLDLFVVEANSALAVTWNVNADLDNSGGFIVRYGVESETYDATVEVGFDARDVVLWPLDNGTTYFIVVETIGADGEGTFTSCEVSALPHMLVFQPDLEVGDASSGPQADPDLASNLEGTGIYLTWDDDSTVVLARSEDFGDSWVVLGPVAIGGEQRAPAVAVRETMIDEEGEIVAEEEVFVAWSDDGEILLASYLPGEDVLTEPVTVGTGERPDIDVGPHVVHLAFERDGAIHHASLDIEGVLATAVAVSGATTVAQAPSVAVHDFTGDVFIAWDALLDGGDADIYFTASLDLGESFGSVVRVDDDGTGQNQHNVSLAVDERTDRIYSTWEDRRGGANVYFTWSEDVGESWEPNIDVGAGLGGDQFRPQAVVDVARNVYVAFHDTTDGQRVVFSRFNAEGSFDPPLAPSTVAGQGGVVADDPTVATDRYGAVYVAWEENRDGPTTGVFFTRAE